MLLLMGGAAGGVWWWKPWRMLTGGSAGIDRAAWDKELTPAGDANAAGRKERWAAEVNKRAQEAEAAFLAKDVEKILQLLPEPVRNDMRPLLEGKRGELDQFGKVLATRKLVAVNEIVADFQVRDGKRVFPVTFAVHDGQWCLEQF